MLYEIVKDLNKFYGLNIDESKAKCADKETKNTELQKIAGLVWFFILNDLTDGLIDNFKIVWLEGSLFGLKDRNHIIEVDIKEVVEDDLLDKLIYNLMLYSYHQKLEPNYDIKKDLKVELNSFIEWKCKKAQAKELNIDVFVADNGYVVMSKEDFDKLMEEYNKLKGK